MAMEYKIGDAEYKTLGDRGEYEGYFSITGNIDDGADIIEQGAFKKTIGERRSRILPMYMHDWEKLLGPPPDVIEEDSRGLYIKGRLTLASFWAGQMVWPLMQDNALKEGSIGFECVAGKVAYEPNNIRRIKEVKLYEYSFVPLGMNPLTEVGTLKALRQAGIDEKALLQFVMSQLTQKAGSRHSKADTDMLDAIHEMAVKLGCTNCKMADPEADSKTETTDDDTGKIDPNAGTTTKTDTPADPAPARAAREALNRQLKARAAALALATASHTRRTT